MTVGISSYFDSKIKLLECRFELAIDFYWWPPHRPNPPAAKCAVSGAIFTAHSTRLAERKIWYIYTRGIYFPPVYDRSFSVKYSNCSTLSCQAATLIKHSWLVFHRTPVRKKTFDSPSSALSDFFWRSFDWRKPLAGNRPDCWGESWSEFQPSVLLQLNFTRLNINQI